MTIYAKNLGGMPPWSPVYTPMLRFVSPSKRFGNRCSKHRVHINARPP